MEMSKKTSFSVLTVLTSMMMLFMILLAGCSSNASSGSQAEKNTGKTEAKVVRIGYQLNCPLVILKSLGTLEKSLGKMGYKVEWKQFQSGTALLEALNAGSIDFGRTGDSPPIFAQAAGTPVVYIAAGKSKYNGSAILVPKNSSIHTLKDLKGKKIGFAKGSSSHYLLIKALENAGIDYKDITPAYLQPADGRVAFEKGNIDAWVVWDPFTASAEVNSGARELVNGQGLTTDRDYFLANESFAKKNKQAIHQIMQEVKNSSQWANEHHEKLVSMLSPLLKIDEQSLKLAVNRRVYGVDELTPQIIKEQQAIADQFFKLGIIPKKVDVKDVIFK
jgi:sulfonate transport system substrate-binding protein